MKKFTLLVGALGIMLSANAQESTLDSQGFKRITADELNAVETSHRIGIRCSQVNDYMTYYNGAGRSTLPLKLEHVYEWVSDGNGKYYIKKAFADEDNAYLQNNNITTFGSKESDAVAKFTAVKPTPSGSGVTLFTGQDCYESPEVGGDYYVRLSLGDKWFNFNGYQYNTGTGVWTVQNIVDLSEYYTVTVNSTIEGVTFTTVLLEKAGEEIEFPVYPGYVSDVTKPVVKTADDAQVVNVTYTFIGPGKLVSDETLATDIVDGAVIALMAKDTNSPDGTYFNGAELKTASFQSSNLFKVVAVEGSTGEYYLQQYVSGKYVGGPTTANALVQAVDDVANANAFTIAAVEAQNWPNASANGSKPDYVSAKNTIRFTTNGTFLNTNSNGNVPKYYTGTSGFSVWYVYTFTPEEVALYVVGDCLEQAELYRPLIGEGVGKYSGVYNDEDITAESYAAMIDAVNAAIEAVDPAATVTLAAQLSAATEALELNMPEGGKFYRIKNNEGTSYLIGGLSGAVQFGAGFETAPGSIFYYTGTKMVSYETGTYLSTNGAQKPFMHYTETLGEAAGTTIEFAESLTLGKYYIIFNGNRYLYSDADGGDANAGSEAANSADANYRFALEEVEELPVEVAGGMLWTSVYSPVGLGLEDIAKAYIGTVNEEGVFVVEEIEAVPANTPVLLQLIDPIADGGQYIYLPVESKVVSVGANDLKGSFEKIAIPTESTEKYYMLYQQEDHAVFISVAGELSGFTAYLTAANAGDIITIEDGEGDDITSGIEEINVDSKQSGFYDLQGRCLSAPVKGINIINGKKVLVK